MSIIVRIRVHGGDVVRDEWRFRLRPGRMTQAAIAWVRARLWEVQREAWPEFDAWNERAAIREFDGGQARADAERDAYEEVMGC